MSCPKLLTSRQSRAALQNFREHLNDLLHRTVTAAPLLAIEVGSRSLLQFRLNGKPTAVDVEKGYYLFLSQQIQATKEKDKGYRVRTLTYAYRIAEGPGLKDRWLFRWEYNSREELDALPPRHHWHLPGELSCFGDQTLKLTKLHIASGWVTIAEVVRFLMNELKVASQQGMGQNLTRERKEV